jgi:hypothetical protein
MGKVGSGIRLIGTLHISSWQHAGASVALRGLGCITVCIIYGILCVGGCRLAMDMLCICKYKFARVDIPASMLKPDVQHPR